MSPGDKRGDKRDRGDIRRQTGDKRRQRGDKKRQRRQKKRHFGNKGVELEEPRKSKIAKNILLCPVTCQEPGMRLFAECPCKWDSKCTCECNVPVHCMLLVPSITGTVNCCL
jgi:hypothetical protein